MKDLLRLTLAGLLAVPLSTTGQTDPDTNESLVESAKATSAENEEEDVYVLPEFVVSSDKDEGYYSANSTSVTRTNTLVKN